MNFIILLLIFVHLILIFAYVSSIGLLVDKKKTFSTNLIATFDILIILLNFFCIVNLVENYLFK